MRYSSIHKISNFDLCLIGLHPQPSTSKAHDQSKKKHNSKLEPEESHDSSNEEDQDTSGWETDPATEDDGK